MPRSKKARLKHKSATTKKNKTATPRKPQTSKKSTSVGKSRAEGIRLFKLAGRPTKEQFQLVYGERGHLMTWKERAKTGVSAKQFQAALAAKQAGR
jgi:hypothetical protein